MLDTCNTRKQSNVPNCIRKIKRFFSIVFVFWTLLHLTDMVIGSSRINGFCRSSIFFFLNFNPKSNVEVHVFHTVLTPTCWTSECPIISCFCLFWISQFGSSHVSTLVFNRDDNNNGACDSSRAVAVFCSLIPCA